MIYLYGLLSCDADVNAVPIDDLAGVTGRVDVTKVSLGYLLHGPAPEGEILPKRRFLLTHTKVLEAFDRAGTLLPMRFGMTAADVHAIDAILEKDSPAIKESFSKLSGAVEFGIRLSFDRTAALEELIAQNRDLKTMRDRLARRQPPPHFETAEFGRRLSEALGRHRLAAQKAALAELRPHLRDFVLRAPEDDAQVLSVDALIPRGGEADLERVLAEVSASCAFAPTAEPQIRLIGPVPAYSFVNLALSSDMVEVA